MARWEGYMTLPQARSWFIVNVAQLAKHWICKPICQPSYRLIAYTCAFLVSFSLSVSFYHLGPFFRPSPDLQPHAKSSPVVWSARAAEVKNAFRHAYSGYQKHALPDDELLPVTGGKENKLSQSCYFANFFINPSCSFNGWSVTVVDSLDTMWLMELYDDFNDAIPIIANTSFISPEVHLIFH
jgi:hypothetical protein